MLILSRRPGESISIGDDVMVTVIGVSGDRVKIGIEAPQHILILREELREAVREENRAGYQVTPKEIRAAIDFLQRLLEPPSREPTDSR
ncbi:MAG TPA: carbon storage regulator CsrA [Anaerolineae bacterium]|nr:carbon storage regulator CsrA [Anaerolineae bacterium]